MNNIDYKRTPFSFGTRLLISGVLVSLNLSAGTIPDDDFCPIEWQPVINAPYIQRSNNDTNVIPKSPITGMYYRDTDNFEEFAIAFYENLLSNQQQLESEIDNIINDNLWDLYES